MAPARRAGVAVSQAMPASTRRWSPPPPASPPPSPGSAAASPSKDRRALAVGITVMATSIETRIEADTAMAMSE